MATTLDSLANLDDKELRKKCLEYGLPNVPITDTSRKLLMKRLLAAIEGSSGKGSEKPKARRTMQVTSTTSEKNEKDDLKKVKASNRRTTIAAVRKEEPATLVDKRRSSRNTPIQETLIPISIKRKANAPILFEENDFEEEFILVDDDDYERSSSFPMGAISRKSRSPSLVKSPVVTTSYKKETFAKNIPEHEVYIESNEVRRKDYNTNKPFVPNRNNNDDNLLDTMKSRYNPSLLPNLSRSSIEKETYPSGYKSIYPNLNFQSSSTKSKVLYDESKATRRFVANETATAGNPYIGRQNINYGENSDSNGDEDDIVEQAPYLSDFARRLSRLKAEPLDTTYKRGLTNTAQVYSAPGISGRRNYKESGGLGESLRQFWSALDRKYKIKRNFFIIFILSLVILVLYYYFF